MGDLLCASPVILTELQEDRAVHLLLFPDFALAAFCELIDFSPHGDRLHLHSMPTSANPMKWKRFMKEMRNLHPETVWISPCAPAADSSWKIPLMLRIIQSLFWRDARMVGADTERFSRLFHQRLPVDRSLPMRLREWSAYYLFRKGSLPERPPKVNFVSEITARRQIPPLYDLVIHPGAKAKNRIWPIQKYDSLVKALPRDWKIAFLGLPNDLESVKTTMSSERPVTYVSGTIRESLETLASARLLLVMDSGNMHFAQVLDVPAVAVFGPTDPKAVIETEGCVDAVYKQRFPCQPCMKAVCNQPEIYCLTSVEPGVVAERLKVQWEKLQKRSNVPAHLVGISVAEAFTPDSSTRSQSYAPAESSPMFDGRSGHHAYAERAQRAGLK